MSVVSRTASGIAEKSQWLLVHSTSLLCICTGIKNSSDGGGGGGNHCSLSHSHLHSLGNNNNNNNIVWMWTAALGLGVFGWKLCSNALEFYRFCATWNLVGRRKQYSKTSRDRRSREIERALVTTTYGDFRRRFFANNKRSSISSISSNNSPSGSAGTTSTGSTEPQHPSPTTSNRAALTETTTFATTTTILSSNPRSWHTLSPEKTCVICLEDFSAEDRISYSRSRSGSSSCRHIFHADCLRAWLRKHSSCPTCRHNIVPEAPMPTVLPSPQRSPVR